MLSLERKNEILEIVNSRKSVTVEELSRELFVSGATIRRDLKVMEGQGLIRRSHGGAVPFKSSADESAFEVRARENVAEKRIIASLASRFIKNGISVFMDSSTTTGFIVPYLNNSNYVSVTTTGLRNAILLSQTSNVKIYIAGGICANHSNSITGTDTMDYISRIHADLAFLSCSGVSASAGFTDADIEQAKLKQQMRKNSDKVIMMCDSTKFGKTFMCKDFDFDEVDYLVTEKKPPEEFIEKISASSCTLLVDDENFL